MDPFMNINKSLTWNLRAWISFNLVYFGHMYWGTVNMFCLRVIQSKQRLYIVFESVQILLLSALAAK